jgi:hypothetical protein
MTKALKFARLVLALPDEDLPFVVHDDDFPHLATMLHRHRRHEEARSALARLLAVARQHAR